MGVVSAFGLGGCNATAVFCVETAKTTTGSPDSMNASLYAETWVRTESNLLRTTAPPIYAGQVIAVPSKKNRVEVWSRGQSSVHP
jgi:hypothetical protein